MLMLCGFMLPPLTLFKHTEALAYAPNSVLPFKAYSYLALSPPPNNFNALWRVSAMVTQPRWLVLRGILHHTHASVMRSEHSLLSLSHPKHVQCSNNIGTTASIRKPHCRAVNTPRASFRVNLAHSIAHSGSQS